MLNILVISLNLMSFSPAMWWEDLSLPHKLGAAGYSVYVNPELRKSSKIAEFDGNRGGVM